MKMHDLDGYSFYVTSMVASRTKAPCVTVTINGADFTVNMSPEDARSLAQNLLQGAAAAENDAFFVEFLRRRVGMSRMWPHCEMP